MNERTNYHTQASAFFTMSTLKQPKLLWVAIPKLKGNAFVDFSLNVEKLQDF